MTIIYTQKQDHSGNCQIWRLIFVMHACKELGAKILKLHLRHSVKSLRLYWVVSDPAMIFNLQTTDPTENEFHLICC